MSKTIAELEKEIGTIKDEPNQKEIDKQQADMLKAAKDARDKKWMKIMDYQDVLGLW